jgi:hypothetical protein
MQQIRGRLSFLDARQNTTGLAGKQQDLPKPSGSAIGQDGL